MSARRWLGLLLPLLIAVPIIGGIAMIWLNGLLGWHPIFGYLALLGCAAYIARQRESLLVEKPFLANLRWVHLVLAIIILLSLFLIGFHHYAWCLNPPYGVNC